MDLPVYGEADNVNSSQRTEFMQINQFIQIPLRRKIASTCLIDHNS